MSNKVASGWSPIAFHEVKISLEPNEEKTLNFLLGYVEVLKGDKFNKDESLNNLPAKKMVKKYSDVAQVDFAFSNLKKKYEDLLSVYHIESDDSSLNNEVNILNSLDVDYYISMSCVDIIYIWSIKFVG